MGRGGPNGPSSLPRLRLRSSDSNRPCSLFGSRLAASRKWVAAVASRGRVFRVLNFRGSKVTKRADLRSKSVRKQAG
jgi:hypothetical protein